MESMEDLKQPNNRIALIITATVLVAAFFLKFALVSRRRWVMSKNSVAAVRFPPGGRGWPLIGNSINWYLAVSSSYPPSFVEDQVKRYV